MPDVVDIIAHGPWPGAVGGFVAGVLLGIVHFGALWINVRLFATGGAVLALCLQVLRFVVLLAVLVALAMAGAAALLAGGLGICLGRRLVLRRIGGV
jgi:F1F0 ATPase subunit 2